MFDFLSMIFDTVADVVDTGQDFLGELFSVFKGDTDLGNVSESVVPTAEPIEAPAPVEPPPAPPPVPQTPVQQPVNAFEGANAGGNVSGNRGIINSTAEWFSNLSPQAQQVLAGGVVGGAAGLMQQLAQRNAQEFQRDREEREREDRTRRGSIPAFGSAFTRRGVIDSVRG